MDQQAGSALDRRSLAGERRDGKVSSRTIRQYLFASLIDELHVAISPVLLGGGEDCSRGLTRVLWDTNAFSSLRQRKPLMLYSGANGTMTPDNRLRRCRAAAEPGR
jgi:hypothetical protein